VLLQRADRLLVLDYRLLEALDFRSESIRLFTCGFECGALFCDGRLQRAGAKRLAFDAALAFENELLEMQHMLGMSITGRGVE